MGQDPLLHEETLSVISTPALDHTALWSSPRVPIGRYFCGHASHRTCGVCGCRPLQWAPYSQGLRRRYSASSWHSQCVKSLGGSLTKRLILLFWVVEGGAGATEHVWRWWDNSVKLLFLFQGSSLGRHAGSPALVDCFLSVFFFCLFEIRS